MFVCFYMLVMYSFHHSSDVLSFGVSSVSLSVNVSLLFPFSALCSVFWYGAGACLAFHRVGRVGFLDRPFGLSLE